MSAKFVRFPELNFAGPGGREEQVTINLFLLTVLPTHKTDKAKDDIGSLLFLDVSCAVAFVYSELCSLALFLCFCLNSLLNSSNYSMVAKNRRSQIIF